MTERVGKVELIDISVGMHKRLFQSSWKIPELLTKDASRLQNTQVLTTSAFRETSHYIKEPNDTVRFLTKILDGESDSDISILKQNPSSDPIQQSALVPVKSQMKPIKQQAIKDYFKPEKL